MLLQCALGKRREGGSPCSIARQPAIALAALLILAGQAKAEDPRAEVIHWWTSGGESAAVKVFADQFRAAGGTWVDTAIAGGANARTAAINRTVGGDPPTAMQFNTGKQFDDLVENDLLANVDAQEAAQNWKAILPAAFVQAVTRNGHAYAVPVNIHGQNWLFYFDRRTGPRRRASRRPTGTNCSRRSTS